MPGCRAVCSKDNAADTRGDRREMFLFQNIAGIKRHIAETYKKRSEEHAVLSITSNNHQCSLPIGRFRVRIKRVMKSSRFIRLEKNLIRKQKEV